MTRRLDRARILALLDGDEELLQRLVSRGIVQSEEAFDPEQVETILVAHTLVRELEVNWPGVEVIIRMRQELRQTQRQVCDLLDFLGKTDRDRR